MPIAKEGLSLNSIKHDKVDFIILDRNFSTYDDQQ